jgi:hypothetical protein
LECGLLVALNFFCARRLELVRSCLTLQHPFISRVRRIWRLAVPFWLFRDASRGSALERRANYRHNRTQRKVLPFFLLKWFALAFCLMQAMLPLSQMLVTVPPGSPAHFIVSLLCMINGVAFAFACVVITLLLAGYLYLSTVED